MTNAKDKQLIESMTALVAELLSAAQHDKNRARKYVQARTKVEQAMRFIGEGIRRTERPPSVGLPVHQKAENPVPKFEEEPPYALADNLEPEQKRSLGQKRRRNAKGTDLGFGDAL